MVAQVELKTRLRTEAIKSMIYWIYLSWSPLMPTVFLLARFGNVTTSVLFVGKKKHDTTVLLLMVQLFKPR